MYECLTKQVPDCFVEQMSPTPVFPALETKWNNHRSVALMHKVVHNDESKVNAKNQLFAKAWNIPAWEPFRKMKRSS